MTDFGHFLSAGALHPALHHDKPQLPVSPTLPYNFFMPPLPPLQNLHLARFHPYLTSQMILRQQAAAAAAAAEARRVTSQPAKKSMQRKRPSSVTVLDLSLPKSSACDAQQSVEAASSNCDVRRSSIEAAKSDADVTRLCWRVTQSRDERGSEKEEEGVGSVSYGSGSPPLTPTTPNMAFKKNMLKRFRKSLLLTCLQ